MRISILMPIQGNDRAEWLNRAVEAIYAQTHKDWELILLDSGVLGDWRLSKRPRYGVRYAFSNTRTGVYEKLNDGLKIATGDVFYFHANDDLLYDSTALERVAAKLPIDQPAWLYGQIESINAEGEPIQSGWPPYLTTLDDMLDHNELCCASVFWNRKMMELAGTFDERYRCASDYDLWLRYWKVTEPIRFPQTVACYRWHSDQHSKIAKDEMQREAREISEKHATDNSPIQVGMLWIGKELGTMERLGICSHLAQGHQVRLYVYKSLLPADADGLEYSVPLGPNDDFLRLDANDIIPQSRIFKSFGRYAAFSDLFRWKMLYEHGGWWSDTDVIALKPWRFQRDYVFASELLHVGSDVPAPTSCVVKAPKGSEVMKWMIAECEKIEPWNLGWMTVGPDMVARAVNEFRLVPSVEPHTTFCPIRWSDTPKFTNGDHLSVPTESYAVHLWDSLWTGLIPEQVIDKDAEYGEDTLYMKLRKRFLSA